MTRYRSEVTVDAPLDTVWQFHSTPEGLRAITPGWMNLRAESVDYPDRADDPEVLVEGTELVVSVRPFGVGSRQRWTSRIVRRERRENEAIFEDEMIDGPFSRWVHTHEFRRTDDGTLVADAIDYRLPPPGLGSIVSPFALVGLEPIFRYRHRATRRLLE